jgi:HlyD family secretion protein
MRKLLVLGIVAAVAAVGIWVYFQAGTSPKEYSFRTAKIEKGPIIRKVSSTGTLSAVTTVQVGSQVSGTILELNADFNSEVDEGQIIARIDSDQFEAKVQQAEADLGIALANLEIRRAGVRRARAELANARSALVSAKANTVNARVALRDSKRDLDRKSSLFKSGAVSKSQFEDAEADHDKAIAQLNAVVATEEALTSAVRSKDAQTQMALAEEAHSLALIQHRQASLSKAKIDLGHTVIRSPLNGVVVGRSVDVGQTVAASLHTPTLFTVAQDLKKMQVDTNLDEADIGRIYVGQKAVFTVDSFPSVNFKGEVLQIRKAPQTIQNVVTYTVVVSADNPDMRLLPGMTANVEIEVAKKPDVMKTPNAALRFRPPAELIASESGRSGSAGPAASGSSAADRLKRLIEVLEMDKDQEARVWEMYSEARDRIVGMMTSGAPREEIRMARDKVKRRIQDGIRAMLNPEQLEKYRRLSSSRAANPIVPGEIWVLDDQGKPRKMPVRIGIDDGDYSEIVQGDVTADQEVLVGLQKSASRKSKKRRWF